MLAIRTLAGGSVVGYNTPHVYADGLREGSFNDTVERRKRRIGGQTVRAILGVEEAGTTMRR
jgi:hypothetical protein